MVGIKLSAMLIDILRRLPYEDNVKWLADHGYEAVDPPVLEPNAGEIARKHGLDVGCASTGGGVVGTTDTAQQAKIREQVINAIPWAAGEGVTCLMVPHGRDTSLPATEQLEGFKQVYGPALEVAEKRGVNLVVENWPNNGNNLMFSPETWGVVFDAIPSERFGLCFDPSHLVWLGIDYVKAARQFIHKIKYLHGKDTEILEDARNQYGIYGRQFAASGGPARWWRYRIPGWGVVDWPAFLTVLYDHEFEGYIAVEHEDPVWRGSEEKFKQGLILAQQFLRPHLV